MLIKVAEMALTRWHLSIFQYNIVPFMNLSGEGVAGSRLGHGESLHHIPASLSCS